MIPRARAGNALFLSDRVRRAAVSHSEFAYVGDSAIATVGRLPLGNDGAAMDSVPLNTSIVRNHFHEIGVSGARACASCRAVALPTRWSACARVS
jgi:hypothetical protein